MTKDFEGVFARRLELDLRLRNLDEKLTRLRDWAPFAEDPGKSVRALNDKRTELIRELGALRESGFAGERPTVDFGERLDPRDERFRQAVIERRQLERVLHRIRARPPIRAEDGPPDPCPSLEGVVWAYHHTEYPIASTGDSSATFSFDPYQSTQLGELRYSASIDNPAPFDWPFVEEYKPVHVLARVAALEFDLPAHWCAHPGGWYDIALRLSLSGRLSGESAFVRVGVTRHVQTSLDQEVTITDFEVDEQRRLEAVADFETTNVDTVSHVGLLDHYMWLNTSERARVHIGLWLSAGSIASTLSVSGSLLIDPLPDETTWGLHYQINAGP